MLFWAQKDSTNIQVQDSLITNNYFKNSLGINIVYNLTFDDHIKVICKKANNKLKPLARVTPLVAFEKKKDFNQFFFLTPSFITALWTGCITVATTATK